MFPDGWQWETMIASALATIAALKTSRTVMAPIAFSDPMNATCAPMSSFAVFRKRTTKCSRSASAASTCRAAVAAAVGSPMVAR